MWLSASCMTRGRECARGWEARVKWDAYSGAGPVDELDYFVACFETNDIRSRETKFCSHICPYLRHANLVNDNLVHGKSYRTRRSILVLKLRERRAAIQGAVIQCTYNR